MTTIQIAIKTERPIKIAIRCPIMRPLTSIGYNIYDEAKGHIKLIIMPEEWRTM